ncbi:MAG: GspE/PulE family protein [Candidatus Berkelbacteria bacterium]|nr:GspE/PulE family protein [Candidatus Berkelbacteria bacterium]
MANQKKENKKSLLEQTLSASRHQQEEQETLKKAKTLGLSYVNIIGFPVNSDTLSIFPTEKARELQAIPYIEVGNNVRIATTDPKNESLTTYLEGLKQKNKLQFTPVLASRSSINYGLSLYEGLIRPTVKNVEEITITKKEYQEEIKDLKNLKSRLDTSSTTMILDILLAGAIGSRASDIHIVPYKNDAIIRFRIDGVLHDISRIPKEKYKNLSSRIKFLSNMKMGEEYLPQDGRFSSKIAGKNIDLRVSTLPTLHGDSIVARLLEEKQKSIRLEELGFNPESLEAIDRAIKKPAGLILNTGPTGSGKTTTLYAIINKLNSREVKIVTLEDPVEYQIEGIDQTQIDPRHDLDFAKGLRAALRQDPDIIMVGEIRDFETASISLHAALTGHLVLTTLHTNNAPAALVRLLDMRIRPFLLVGSINLAIAQRLVRLICPECKKEHNPTRYEKTVLENYLKKIHIKKMSQLYKGGGCNACNNTGYFGRTAIIEFLEPGEKIEKLIVEGATQTKVEKEAIRLGMKTMREDGLDKVIAGQTTMAEVLRVTSEY